MFGKFDFMKIFYFGNFVVPEDSLVIKLIPMLKKSFSEIQFIHSDPTDEWWCAEEIPVIIDSVAILKKVTLFKDLSSFDRPNFRITPHDYDLFMDLSLLIKLKKIKSFEIIGVPNIGNIVELFSDVCDLIKPNYL